MQTKEKQKKIILGGIVLVLLLVIFAGVFFLFGPKARKDNNWITIQAQVVLQDGSSKTYDIKTKETYLRGALEQENLISGTESEHGLFVTTVDTVTADDSKQEWWCFTKNGESLMTGVDSTPIADGDHYEITLTTGY